MTIKSALLVFLMIVSRPLRAVDASPAGENADVVSQVLQNCPAEARRVFLGSIEFVGDKAASLGYASIENCLV